MVRITNSKSKTFFKSFNRPVKCKKYVPLTRQKLFSDLKTNLGWSILPGLIFGLLKRKELCANCYYPKDEH